MKAKGKLELIWVGKEDRPRLEPRVLVEDSALSYGDPRSENMLIHGDNLLALKALEQDFAGKIKCIYIDPPFNTQQAFEHYDDGVEHSVWLSLIRDRLAILHSLLHPSGSLYVHIDDTELGYLIAVADEVFGRKNRVSVITFKQSSASGPKAVNPGLVTTSNFLLYYAKNKELWKSFKVFVPTDRDDRYSKCIANFDEPFGAWKIINLKDAFCKFHRGSWNDVRARFADKLEAKLEEFVLANAYRVVRTARVAARDVNADARGALNESTKKPDMVFRSERTGKDDYYFLNGEQLLFYRTKTRTINGRITTASVATNLWDDVLSNNLHKEGGVVFPKGKKPEFLLKRVIELSTEPGDLVLDSFAGSGTTGAVAHKMGRRWIMVELGEHCHTHILPRLRRVVDGRDPSGITEAVNWNGGGGFRYHRLAESLLVKDKQLSTPKKPVYIINPKYDATMLIRAICKIENFRYGKDDRWHGASSERHFLYVTTILLTQRYLDSLAADLGDEDTMLIYCTRRVRGLKIPDNIEVKKIPRDLLTKCAFEETK